MAEHKGDNFKYPECINIKVMTADNIVNNFKIKNHCPMVKLINLYCEMHDLAKTTVRFRFDGGAINEDDTPFSLKMEEGDTIEIFQIQTGGCFYFNYY